VLTFETPRKGQEILSRDRPDYEDLAQDPRGRIYALDQRSGAVMRIDLDRRWDGIVKQSNAWRKPVAIAVDRLGQIYLLDRGAGTVEVYDTDGSRIDTLGPQLGGGIELRDPEDLAVDGLGRIFIADAKLPFVVVLE
jgi:sugar lactone lactonase YvrE